MFSHKADHFSIYFGGVQDQLMPAWYLNLPDTPLLELAPFSRLKASFGLHDLMFLHQIHSDKGVLVDQDCLGINRPFKVDGDYLVTAMKHVGIGVMTADCLPIMLYDSQNKSVAAIHAGWRGSVAGIAVKALEHMQEACGTQPSAITVFFGPSARVCCYEVSKGFEEHLAGFSWLDKQQVLVQRDNKLFFNVPLFNQLQLEAAGVANAAISTEYNLCTMCDSSFYSSRRDNSGRQMTVIWLTV